ncbi:MAG: hypothetical protein J6Y78_14645 [Paludibacteraceae bacterium]|nr:hypothetical protein [Clostridiales bacterium]MBP5423670.1 hypothetical protein [Paludibacteraceae bacterium]
MEDEISVWFNEQPAWMRVAVEQYIINAKIDDSKITKLADICLSEAKGDDCSKYIVSSTNLLMFGTGKSFAIQSISDIKGVNALDTDKAMCFVDKGINVVYGANGSGKSGYIRIFKMVSGATYRENIKPNIYKTKRVNPRCDITIKEDGKSPQTLSCNLLKAGEYGILKRIDIFDSKIAQGYISEEKEASFEPWIFSLFSCLGETAAKVKEELNERKEKVHLEKYNIPEELTDDPEVKLLDKLSYHSKLEEYVKDYNEKDEERLVDLTGKLQIEKNELNIRLNDEKITNLIEIGEYFKSFESFYKADNLEKISALAKDWESKKHAYDLSEELLNKNIDSIDKRKSNNDAWRELWKQARMLFDSIKDKEEKDYTECGGVCPLCHQIIPASLAERMKTIDEYVNGIAASSEQLAKANYCKAIIYPQIVDTHDIIKKIGDVDPDLNEQIVIVNNDLIDNRMSIDNVVDKPVTLKTVDLSKVIISLENIVRGLELENDNLHKLNTVEDQIKIRDEIRALKIKKVMKANEQTIRENISKLQKIQLLNEAVKYTSTNKLTSKSKELAKLHITDAYINRFNDELKKLSGSGLTAQIVQGKGRAGRNPYRVQLCNAEGEYVSPKDILSEGESRAVSLAAFFAEASGRTETCPLIVDDPISSLDYEYEERVIARLAEAAQNRQVIVFTHRISLVVGLSEKLNNSSLFNELSLRATKDRKGIPGSPDVSAGKSDKILNKLINENLPKLNKMDELSEEYKREKHYICQQFRNCVEKSVEEYLLGEVVMRFRRDVQTKRIKCLPSITLSDCDMIDKMMSKYSAYDHSMSYEAPLIEFEVSDIEKDMTDFSSWISARKKNMK